MSEQQVVQTVGSIDSVSGLGAKLRQLAIALLVLLILAGVWYGASELLVFLLRDAGAFAPRFS